MRFFGDKKRYGGCVVCSATVLRIAHKVMRQFSKIVCSATVLRIADKVMRQFSLTVFGQPTSVFCHLYSLKCCPAPFWSCIPKWKMVLSGSVVGIQCALIFILFFYFLTDKLSMEFDTFCGLWFLIVHAVKKYWLPALQYANAGI